LDYVEEILAKLDKADRALASISGSLQYFDNVLYDTFDKKGDKHTEILNDLTKVENKKALNQIKRIANNILQESWKEFGYYSHRGRLIRRTCGSLIAKIDRRIGKIHWNKCSAKIIKCEEPSWKHKYYWKYDKAHRKVDKSLPNLGKIEFVYCLNLNDILEICGVWEAGVIDVINGNYLKNKLIWRW